MFRTYSLTIIYYEKKSVLSVFFVRIIFESKRELWERIGELFE